MDVRVVNGATCKKNFLKVITTSTMKRWKIAQRNLAAKIHTNDLLLVLSIISPSPLP